MFIGVTARKYAFYVELEPEKDRITDNLGIQVSFLHTNQDRKRVIRVINCTIAVSNDPTEIYEACDSSTVAQGTPLISLNHSPDEKTIHQFLHSPTSK